MSILLVAAVSALPHKGNDNVRMLEAANAASQETAAAAHSGMKVLKASIGDWKDSSKNINKDVSAMNAAAGKFNSAVEAEMKAVKQLGEGPLMDAHGPKERAAYADIQKQGAKLTGSIEKHSKQIKQQKMKGEWAQKEAAEMEQIKGDLSLIEKAENKAIAAGKKLLE